MPHIPRSHLAMFCALITLLAIIGVGLCAVAAVCDDRFVFREGNPLCDTMVWGGILAICAGTLTGKFAQAQIPQGN